MGMTDKERFEAEREARTEASFLSIGYKKNAEGRWVPAEQVDEDALTPARRRALLPLWALCEAESHSPRTNEYGYTCDELGCAICNMGAEEFVEFVCRYADEDDVLRPFPWPSDDEIVEAVREWCDGNLAEAPE